jgi:outer membrane protein TolC
VATKTIQEGLEVKHRKIFHLMFLLSVSAILAPVAPAQDLRGPIISQDRNSATSVQDILIGNPIQLHVTKSAPSGDLPEKTGQIGIDEAVQTGLKNNFTLQQVEQTRIGAKYLKRAALAKFGPTVSFNTFYSTSSLNQMLFLPGDTTVSSPPMQPIVKGTSLSLIFAGSQPLFTGGRLMGNYRAAKALERQSLYAFDEQRIRTALAVKESYWNAAWSEASLRVASDYVKFREWSSSNMKARMLEGKAPRADYLREEAELAKARIQLNERYRDFNSAILNLKVAMAINLGSQIGLKDSLEYVEITGDASKFLEEAARNRPEITKSANKVAEMKARKQIAWSKYSPQVSLYGLGSNIKGSSPDGNANGRWGGFVGIVGGVTLFDSGSRVNELRAASAAVKEAELGQKATELRVAQEVTQAWIDLDLARRNVTLANDQVKSAEEDHRLFHTRYEIGKSIALEQFDAAVKMFQARLILQEAIYKYRLAQSRLVFASGGI